MLKCLLSYACLHNIPIPEGIKAVYCAILQHTKCQKNTLKRSKFLTKPGYIVDIMLTGGGFWKIFPISFVYSAIVPTSHNRLIHSKLLYQNPHPTYLHQPTFSLTPSIPSNPSPKSDPKIYPFYTTNYPFYTCQILEIMVQYRQNKRDVFVIVYNLFTHSLPKYGII